MTVQASKVTVAWRCCPGFCTATKASVADVSCSESRRVMSRLLARLCTSDQVQLFSGLTVVFLADSPSNLSDMSKKRTLDAFFGTAPKRPKTEAEDQSVDDVNVRDQPLAPKSLV